MKDDRGDNDLEVVIDKLTKQKELLQFQCRKAGDTISGYKSRDPWSKVRETYLHVSWNTDHGA
jgi:hypothetical protein